jgi:hypothetical protein
VDDPRLGGSAVAGQRNALTWRDRALGALFVLAAVAAQSYWMGNGVILLSAGLGVVYLVWAAAPWNNDPARVLPVYVLAVFVQCLHFSEEFSTGFQREFPKLLGSQWSDARFAEFNLAWIAIFVLAGFGVHRRVPLAYLIVLFLAAIGGVGNGINHLLLSAIDRRYFSGAVTAPLCLLMGILLLGRLFRKQPVDLA